MKEQDAQKPIELLGENKRRKGELSNKQVRKALWVEVENWLPIMEYRA